MKIITFNSKHWIGIIGFYMICFGLLLLLFSFIPFYSWVFELIRVIVSVILISLFTKTNKI